MNNLDKYKKEPGKAGFVFLTVPIFTRLLTTEQYGLLTVYQSWMAIISVFTTLNLSAGVFNNGMIKRKRAVHHCYGGFLHSQKPNHSDFLLVLAMFLELFMSPALALWSAKQRFSYKYRAMTAITVTISLANVGVGLLAVSLAEEKGVARVLSAAIVNICAGLVLYVFNMIKGKNFFS